MAASDAQHLAGLTTAEVETRISKGEVNTNVDVKTRSIKQIVRDNVFTLFNFINVVLAIFVAITGSYKNMLFMVVIICNLVIGIVQEIRSKQLTDRLSVIAGSKVTVIRDGKQTAISLDDIVLDDIVLLSRGSQVPADCEVIEGECSVDESLLTGESKLIKKAAGDELLSGTFVNAGSVFAKVLHVGADNYAAKITSEAKQHKAINSEIMRSLNGIVKYVSIFLFPIGLLLFGREFWLSGTDFNESILSTVSALVGMIPEGLILLTSTVLAVAVIRLGQKNVLVQQLYCIETLARVDVLCLDKTGTITTGGMSVEDVVQAASNKGEKDALNAILYAIASSDADPNDTAKAIIDYCESTHANAAKAAEIKIARTIPFSSDMKYSGIVTANGDSYAMGAAQFVMGDSFSSVEEEVDGLDADARIILVAKVGGFDDDGKIEGERNALGFALLHDQIRDTAAQTIEYFKEQGVTLKVISGDDPRTVSHIAVKVGVPDADKYVDASTLKTDADIEDAIEKYAVFGRVLPEQKKAFVLALQKFGHIVAMTGDGVNDTLALKAADCSIAMASGSDAARNVAQLVLVDNDFASMPEVVAEGRRSINNLERSASLFLVKTGFSIFLAVVFILLPWQYPFQPIQMTLVSAFTIGLPSFVLALQPNHDRIKGAFLENCVVRALPGAICAIIMVLIMNLIAYELLGFDYDQLSTVCILLLCFNGIMLVIRLSIPYNLLRSALLVVCVGCILGCVLILPKLFDISPITPEMAWCLIIGSAIIAIAFNLLYAFCVAWHDRRIASKP